MSSSHGKKEGNNPPPGGILAMKTTRRNESKNNKKNNNVNKMSKEYSVLLFEAENPFSLPNDNDIFHLTEEKSGDENDERKDKKKEKRPLKAHEKTTYISRMNATNTQIVKVRDLPRIPEKRMENRK